jgi:heme/copper-type cytochrome/quinol oxidase subunit 2
MACVPHVICHEQTYYHQPIPLKSCNDGHVTHVLGCKACKRRAKHESIKFWLSILVLLVFVMVVVVVVVIGVSVYFAIQNDKTDDANASKTAS